MSDTRGQFLTAYRGSAVDDVLLNELGMPTVPSAINNKFVRAVHSVNGGGVRTTLHFGDISDPNLPNLTVLQARRNGLKPLPLQIIEATGGGFGTVKLLTFAKGWVEFGNTIVRLMGTSGAAGSDYNATVVAGTLTGTFAGSFALGTTAIASYIAPTSTLGNLVTSGTIVAGVASVSGTTASPGMSNRNTATLTGLLDNSGGTASATIATFATGATVLAAHQNAIASLVAQVNTLMKLFTGTDTIGAAGGTVSSRRSLDGTTTAKEVWFNQVVVDDATAAGLMYLEGRIIIDWRYTSAVPVTPTVYRAEGVG